MERITQKMLERRVALINTVLGAAPKPYRRDADGTFHANKGTYSLGYAYGGVRLERDGGSVDVSPRGTKRQIWEFMGAFLDGIEAGRK